MRRKFLIGLLAVGTVVGFGSGFASVAYRIRHGGGCHRGYDGAWSRYDGDGASWRRGWHRGQGPSSASVNSVNAAPSVATSTPPPVAPNTPAGSTSAPGNTAIAPATASAAPPLQPIVITLGPITSAPLAGNVAAPAQQYAAPSAVFATPTVSYPSTAGTHGAAPPIRLSITVDPATGQASVQQVAPAQR